MAERPSIDAFAFCVSPFAAPFAIAIGHFLLPFAGKTDSTSLSGNFFWSLVFGAAITPFSILVSMPFAWLLARLIYPKKILRSQLIVSTITSTAILVIFYIAFFSWQSNLKTAFLSIQVCILNTLVFLWISKAPNISFLKRPTGTTP